MTNTDRILAEINAHPGLTDAELVRRTGITPHQQVNGICNRLAARGQIRRVPGPNGTIVNLPAGTTPVAVPTRPQKSTHVSTTRSQPSTPTPSTSRGDASLIEVAQIDPTTTLILIPCSGGKARGGNAPPGPGFCDALPEPLAAELLAARQRVQPRITFDARRLMPAINRYTGFFYEAAGATVRAAVQSGQPLLILSGGYGALLPTEPIGHYEAPFDTAWWPDAVVPRSVPAYAQAQGLTTLVAFLARSTDYAKALRQHRWSNSGLTCYLVTPDTAGAGGALRAAPKASGEACSAFLQRRLQPGWRSAAGYALLVERLP